MEDPDDTLTGDKLPPLTVLVKTDVDVTVLVAAAAARGPAR